VGVPPLWIDADVAERVNRLDLQFNRYGLDPLGISREHLSAFYSLLAPFYRRYFRVRAVGLEHVPDRGRAMLVGNHSGGLPVDGGMVLASLILDKDPPRHAHGMVEKFVYWWPFVSTWFSRIGQLTGLPEHALRILEDDRLLLVFPEGVRGTGKLYKDRYKLERFGTGFIRLALKTRAPIVPFAFVGGEEAIPTVIHLNSLARLVRAPYWPVPKQILPIPLPVHCEVHYGAPLYFDGDGTEADDLIEEMVDRVKERIASLIEQGNLSRRGGGR
jgi:1-acyl-sn-glycerol-3-phosphate acyltransferase